MQLEQLLAKQGKKGVYNGGTLKSDINEDTFLVALELTMIVLLFCDGCYSFCSIRIYV